MGFSRKRLFVALGLSLFVPLAEQLPAQQADSVRSRFLLDIPPVEGRRGRSWPAMNIQTPSGYGARWGDWFVGVGYQKRTRYTTTQDGIAGGGFGLGNPSTYVGLEVDVASVSTVYQRFLKNSLAGFKLHRLFPGAVGIAVGWDDAIHTAGVDAQSSLYVVGSKTFFTRQSSKEWFSSITASLGFGNGRFRPETDTTLAPGSPNLFGDVGIRIAEPLSLIGDWNGQDLTLGMSFVPFARLPFVVTPGITDFTHHAGDGRRFIIGAGFGFSFARSTP